MSAREPRIPMAPDVLYLWRLLEPALEARGLLEGSLQSEGRHLVRRDIAELLAFAVAIERRAAARIPELTSTRDRKSAERARMHLRRQARVHAVLLGLLPADRLDAAPVDARGHDPEIAEWFGLDREAFEIEIRKALALPKLGAAQEED